MKGKIKKFLILLGLSIKIPLIFIGGVLLTASLGFFVNYFIPELDVGIIALVITVLISIFIVVCVYKHRMAKL